MPHSFVVLAVDNEVTIALHFHVTNFTVMFNFIPLQIKDLAILELLDDKMLVAVEPYLIVSSLLVIALVASIEDNLVILPSLQGSICNSCFELDGESHAESGCHNDVLS